jgi:hypothetical protein
MDHVKKMSKFTVLSELNRLVGKNSTIKGTYVKTLKQDDIFDTPVNKTTELHTIKSGSKKILVPLVKPEPVQVGAISDREVSKLLSTVKDSRARKILNEYLEQNKNLETSIMDERLMNRKISKTEELRGIKEKAQMKGNTTFLAIDNDHYRGLEKDENIKDLVAQERALRNKIRAKLGYKGVDDDVQTDSLGGPSKYDTKVHLNAPMGHRDDHYRGLGKEAEQDSDKSAESEEDEDVIDTLIEQRKDISTDLKITKFKTMKDFELYKVKNHVDDLARQLKEHKQTSQLSLLSKSLNKVEKVLKAKEESEELKRRVKATEALHAKMAEDEEKEKARKAAAYIQHLAEEAAKEKATKAAKAEKKKKGKK